MLRYLAKPPHKWFGSTASLAEASAFKSSTTFWSLPRELRDEIYSYIFVNNGVADVAHHLTYGRFSLSHSALESTRNLRILRTSRQFYAEAFPIAYALTCFYFSRSAAGEGQDFLPGWSERQIRCTWHVALWADPLVWDSKPRTDDAFARAGLKVQTLTLCDASISSQYRGFAVTGDVYAKWLLEIVAKMEELRELKFLVGRVSSYKGRAAEVRQALRGTSFERFQKGFSAGEMVELTAFEEPEYVAVLTICAKGKPRREVRLTVATTAVLLERKVWADVKGFDLYPVMKM